MRVRSCFLLLLSAFLAWTLPAQPAAAVDKIFWSGHTADKIQFANLDGSGGGDLNVSGSASAIDTPGGTAVDAAAGRVYWINDTGPISYANLDGSGGSADLSSSGAVISSARGLAIDPEAGRLYWANQDTNTLYYANTDGSGGGPISTTGTGAKQSANGVSIDPTHNRIYWNNGALNTIGYANLDGSGGGGNLNTSGASVSLPFGTAIDPSSGRLYITNYSAGISYAALDGSGGGDLSISGATPAVPYGAAIDPNSNSIYWTNLVAHTIGLVGLPGGSGQLLDTTGTDTAGLWIYPALLMAPAGETLPQVTGGSTPGATLSCTEGSWAADLVEGHQSQAPRGASSYQWTLDGSNIGGATSDTVSADAPGDYRCEVTASNDAGETTQTSAAHTIPGPPTPPPSPSPTPSPTGPKPTIAKLTISAKKPRKSTKQLTFGFELSEPATVNMVIQRKYGRKHRQACRRTNAKTRLDKRCTIYRDEMSQSKSASAGEGSITIATSGLSPGAYRVLLTATNAAGTSAPTRAIFYRPWW